MGLTGIIITVAALLLGFLITFKSIPVVIKVSLLRGLMDCPDGDRKVHKHRVPNLGGIGVFAGFVISFGIFIGFDLPQYFPALIAAITVLFFVGIKDDILVIAPLKKLAGQIIAACMVVFVGGIYIPGLDGLFGVGLFPVWFAKIFSAAAIIFIINAYNLIDGVDGLAGLLSIVSVLVLGIWFLIGGHYAESILSFALAGALLGFLMHNFEPARIFMGDTGSLIIGLILAVTSFRLVQLNAVTEGIHLQAPAVFIFSVMIVPIYDVFRVIVIRLYRGCSPLKADTSHVHHFLMRLGLRHYQIAIVLTIFNISIVVLSFMIQHINVYLYLFTVVIAASLITPVMMVLKGLVVHFFLQGSKIDNSFLVDHILYLKWAQSHRSGKHTPANRRKGKKKYAA
ncbi:MAG: MraY family glycosyltransferase [Dethiobacteria bacterium]